MNLRRRILLFTLLPVTLIFATIFGLRAVWIQKQAERDVSAHMTELTGRCAALLDGRLESAARIATATAAFMETHPDATESQIFAQLRANVELDPLVYGAAMGFADGAFEGRSRFCPYVYRGPGGLVDMDIAGVFDYTDGTWQWWTDPETTARAVWTAPYFDEGAGNILMSTWSVPFFTPDGVFRGVTTIDIPLAPLADRAGIADIRDLDFIVVSGDGEYVYHPDPERILGETIGEEAARLDRDDLATLADRLGSGATGLVRLPGWDDDPSERWVFHAPIESTGWAFAARIPATEALAGASEQRMMTALLFAASLATIIVVIWFVSGLIARPAAAGGAVTPAVSAGATGVRNRLKVLGVSVVMLTLIATGVAAVTILLLYDAARNEQTRALADLVQSQTRLIDAVARFDRRSGVETDHAAAAAATVSQVVDAHQGSAGLGETGEILLGRRVGDEIEFLLERRHAGADMDRLVPFDGRRAEPLRRALQGRSGVDVVEDYRGEKVLAAYEPVEELGLGIVAKIDLAEVRGPFVKAATYASLTGLLLVIVGAMLVVAVNSPLIKKVEDSENQVRTILATAREGFWFMDIDGRTLEANPAFCEILGRAHDDVVGSRVDDFADGDDADRFRRAMADADAGGAAHEMTLRHRDGTAVPCMLHATPFFDEHGAQVGSFALVTDLTDRKRYEAELMDARAGAEAANLAKSEFLSNMSHELRTPLNGVLGYAQILRRDTSIGGRQRENLDAIESCGQHLLTLINDVLDLSKIEAGRLEVHREPCDLHRLLASVFDIVRPRAESKGLTVSLDVSPEVPRGIVTDTTKLKQTLVNLLGNAVKFTEQGSVGLRVRESVDATIEMVVTDTGMGMTDAEVAGIFDPFKQAEGGRVAGGTGLGLAISKRIIEALGGSLDVRSTHGAGSTFTILLPFEEVHEETMTALDDPGELDDTHPVLAPGQDVTILITDDRKANRDILVQLLETAGFATTEACDGAEALAVMKRQRFDLVLMDVRMPVMNGIEATQAIRADETLRGIPVIAVTASVFPEFRHHVKESGFDDFIAKPFRTAEVFSAIERHLEVRFDAVTADAGPGDDDDAVAVPPDVAAEIAGRLRAALKVKSLTAINKLAEELRAGDDGRAAVGTSIEERARAFDFAGLETLADGLEKA